MAELIDFNKAKENKARREAERARKKRAQAASQDQGARFRATLDQILKNALSSMGQVGVSGNLQVVTTVEIVDAREELQVKFALPGIEKEQLQLEFSDNLLRINVKPRQSEAITSEGLKNQGFGLTQSIPLPYRVSADDARATFDESSLLVVSFKKLGGASEKFTPLEIL